MNSTEHHTHDGHAHKHGAQCGHTALKHNGHTDYLHDGHLHSTHEQHIDEHTLDVDSANPANCTPDHVCAGHDPSHRHSATCGHEAVPHGDHTDYLVGNHLHHFHGDHCDHHGEVAVSQTH